MFSTLPCDILRLVLEDYLEVDVLGLSKLDIAFCNHKSRLPALSALSQVRAKDKEVQLLENHMKWLASRKFTTNLLAVNVHCFRNIAGLELPHITRLAFQRIGRHPVHTASVGPFLECYPNLKELSFDAWTDIKDLALLQFCQCAASCPLEVLDLKGCHNLSPEVVCMLVTSCQSTLREFGCEVLCDDSVLAIAALGLNLRSLTIGCSQLSRSDGLIQLCASTPHLLELRLNDTNNDIVDVGVVRITEGCSQLQSVEIFLEKENGHFMKDSELILVALGSCSSMKHVIIEHVHDNDPDRGGVGNNLLWEATFSYRAPDGKRMCDLSVGTFVGDGKDLMFAAICHVLASNGIGIRRMVWTDADYFGGKSDLRMLADAFGADLEELDCRPTNDLNADTLNYFLSRCPNLTKLRLGSNYNGTIDNACIAHLADCCPKIISLQLHQGSISDDAMIAMLEGYRGSALTNIAFFLCYNLSNVTLLKIAELFPVLDVLVIGGKVARETLLDFVVSGKLQVKQVGTSDFQNNTWLKAQLALHFADKPWTMPIVDTRYY